MNKLYLVRHAKSSKSIPELKDIDRPLTERGYHDARNTAKQLAQKKIKPDLMISSPAVRAITTSLIFAQELKYPYAEIRLNEDLYSDDFKKIIKVIESIKPEYKNVFIFGHNPAFENLAKHISSIKIAEIKTSDVLCFELGDQIKLSKKKHKLIASFSAEKSAAKMKK
ncbi:MAG: histidine phosphatase family protein [Bacteroidia bacterium]|nr:histidine phosphatase family protein [Bacteroidia bacterium]